MTIKPPRSKAVFFNFTRLSDHYYDPANAVLCYLPPITRPYSYPSSESKQCSSREPSPLPRYLDRHPAETSSSQQNPPHPSPARRATSSRSVSRRSRQQSLLQPTHRIGSRATKDAGSTSCDRMKAGTWASARTGASEPIESSAWRGP